jgi:hypothetical protein
MNYNTYTFDSFPYLDKLLTIPPYTVFYRGVPNGKNIPNLDVLRSSTPIYIASKDIANRYSMVPENDLLFKISNIHELKLIDMRKIISMMPMILNNIEYNNNKTNISIFNNLKIVLGFTSIDEQIALLQKDDFKYRIKQLIDFSNTPRFVNSGVRLPITNFDQNMILIIKEIFSSYCDGIISPQLKTPFETSGFSHEEIILFDTSKLKIVDFNDANIVEKHITTLFGLVLLKFFTLMFHKIILNSY